jgi:hypothetical protein
VGASPKATVRCPLCQAEFALAEILDGLPPTLIVVSDPEPPAVPAIAPLAAAGALEAARPAVTSEDAGVEPLDHVEDLLAQSLEEEGGEPRISVSEPGEGEPAADEWGATPAFVIKERDAAEAAAPEAARVRRPAGARLHKKGTHPLLKMGGLTVAGLCGAVFAQLVLWWLPWEVFPNRDPVDLGPKVAGVIPWIVPKTLRGDAEPRGVSQSPDTPPSEPQVNHPKPVQPPKVTGKNAGKNKDPHVKLSDSGLPIQDFAGIDRERPSLSKPVADGAKKKKKLEVESDFAAAPPLQPEKPNLADLTSNPLLDNMPLNPVSPTAQDAKPEAVAPASKTPAEPPMENAPVVRLKNAPPITADDFKETLAKAQQAGEDWKSTGKVQLPSYMTLLKLAEAVTCADQAAEADVNTAADLLHSIVEAPERLDFLARAGARLLRGPQRDNNGLLLVGVVKQITARGELYETQLELAPGESPVSVFSDVDPAQDFQPNDRLLVVGVLVNKPAEALVGYAGDAESTVWAGYCEVLGK